MPPTTTAGPGKMTVSDSEYTTGDPHHVYLRFNLPHDVAAGPFNSVTLRLRVSNTQYSESDNSGQIWRVIPFVRDDLFDGSPNTVGNGPLAGSQGGVNQGQTVDFALPADNSFVENGSVFLGIEALTGDDTDYENLNGANPPQLLIECPN